MTAYELGNDWNLWRDYIDPGCCYSREDWDAMSEEEREALARTVMELNV